MVRARFEEARLAVLQRIDAFQTTLEEVDAWAAQHKRNIFGQELRVVEMQSEAGAGEFYAQAQQGLKQLFL